MTIPIIDTHQHLWDLSKVEYPWLVPAYGPLYRTYLAAELAPQLAEAGVRRDGAGAVGQQLRRHGLHAGPGRRLPLDDRRGGLDGPAGPGRHGQGHRALPAEPPLQGHAPPDPRGARSAVAVAADGLGEPASADRGRLHLRRGGHQARASGLPAGAGRAGSQPAHGHRPPGPAALPGRRAGPMGRGHAHRRPEPQRLRQDLRPGHGQRRLGRVDG